MTNGGKGVAVLAIGGNSLIRDKQHQRVNDQFEVTRETCQHRRASTWRSCCPSAGTSC
jgi:hypothetical protein